MHIINKLKLLMTKYPIEIHRVYFKLFMDLNNKVFQPLFLLII